MTRLFPDRYWTANGPFFPSFSAIFNRKMQKLPLFSCILLRNEGKTDQMHGWLQWAGTDAEMDEMIALPSWAEAEWKHVMTEHKQGRPALF